MRIGATRVTRIAEIEGPRSTPGTLFPDLDRAAFDQHLHWLAPGHYRPGQDRLVSSFHTWLIRTERHTILVDTCAGNDKERPENPGFHRLRTPWLDRLAATGVTPGQVDIVLCTHLHADHCGWNTMLIDGRWVPTFPNARYIVSRAELDRADTRRRPLRPGDLDTGVFDDSVLPILDAGLALPIEGVHAIDDTLQVEPAPGHTVGSVLLRLCDAGQEAVFTGDIVHHPIQVWHPEWNSRYCELPDLARRTRRRVLAEAADRDVLLCPAHFAAPYCGRVIGTASGFEFRFAQPGL